MNYSAINIQGNIVSSEILEKVRTEDTRFQKAIDFGLPPSASVRDEINLAWSLAVSNWTVFKSKRENLLDSDTGTAETRRYWMLPLLQVLGYELTTSNAEIINGKSYAISHRANNKDGFPIHIVGVNQSLDKRADSGGTRLSPHALVQEYLNNNEHLYAFVTNGRFIRVLRDATRLSRLSYLEFDLEQIMEEGLYVEFALMYRVLHASRMPEKQDSGAECFLEFYHQEALASGSRIRERLSVAVENSIKELANGLLQNPKNQELREKVLNGDLAAKEYYLHTLRLVYRVLFLLVIEERKLIYPDKRDEDLNRKRSIYYDFYSVQRLTKLAEKLIYVDPRKTDLWQSLITTFALFEHEQYGKKLGISPLGAGIFSPNALGIISHQLIDNETLLRVLRYLVTFENEQGQRVRVNYADLDVEEFGSVYEGLLDYDPEITDNAGEPIFGFVKGDDRSSSGSHYTPEELVRPLIKHSLDYLIEDKLKEADPEKGLLSLTICDVACGSGHILLSAARRVGFELAKVRSKEDQPTPSVLRVAVRDVIRHCIYGVDLNPLAVELCKVALWLEAHEPGEPLNFLDHHIKCGNAIVGLAHAEELEKGIASEAFKTLPGDDKKIASAFKKRNDQELKTSGQLSTFDVDKVDNELKDVQTDFSKFAQLPENTPEQIAKKEKAYQDLTNGKKWWRLKNLADLQVAQFFIPKTMANKESLTTHSQYMTYLKQGTQIFDRGASMAISQDKRFFHWFLEFPEVFQKGGFDCILGNPPYLGGTIISNRYGTSLTNYLYFNYHPASNRCDLVGYFVRRDFDIIRKSGFISLITTDAITSGDTLKGSLEFIHQSDGEFVYAIKTMPWPGVAATNISLFSIEKGISNRIKFINKDQVDGITPRLESGENYLSPFTLNKSKSLKTSLGIKTYGDAFIIDSETKRELSNSLSEKSRLIFKWIDGDFLNNSPDLDTNSFVINVNTLSINELKNYSKIYEYLNQKVRPEREKLGNERSWDVKFKEIWWHHADKRVEFFNSLNDKFFIFSRAAKYLNFSLVSSDIQFSDNIVGINESIEVVTVLQSSFHSEWAWSLSKKTGGSTIRYSTTSCLETFPLCSFDESNKHAILKAGTDFFIKRTQYMVSTNLGLTKLYNHIHSKSINLSKNNEKDKLVVDLKLHLEKTPNTISFDEAVKGIIKLRELHKEMDESVLQAYGWHQDDPKWGKAIELRHDFYEVDYLPENDRVRYTIHSESRKEVLKRLLQLNHERYEEEIKQGLHKKKDVEAFYKQKNKPVPEEISFSDVKAKKTKAKKKKIANSIDSIGEQTRSQASLFPEPEQQNEESLENDGFFRYNSKIHEKPSKEAFAKNVIKLGSVVLLKSTDGKEIKIACGSKFDGAQSLQPDSAFVKALLGKKVGDEVSFGNGFEVVKID